MSAALPMNGWMDGWMKGWMDGCFVVGFGLWVCGSSQRIAHTSLVICPFLVVYHIMESSLLGNFWSSIFFIKNVPPSTPFIIFINLGGAHFMEQKWRPQDWTSKFSQLYTNAKRPKLTSNGRISPTTPYSSESWAQGLSDEYRGVGEILPFGGQFWPSYVRI